MNPLSSVRGAIMAGVILAVIMMLAIEPRGFAELGLAIWIHIVAGVMWIGLLYYLNVVHAPGLEAAAADRGGPGGAGLNKYIAPRALLWFRWSAVATWLTGVWYLARANNLANAMSLGRLGRDHYGLVIGIGGWLGTIMLLNGWLLIWPAQKRILGLVPATEQQRAQARRVAGLANRVNFVLSVPLLLCMGGANHPLPF
ncbi:MAG TPA: hypothetical protein VIX87_10910 [Steroidobacteraceae bacterium]